MKKLRLLITFLMLAAVLVIFCAPHMQTSFGSRRTAFTPLIRKNASTIKANGMRTRNRERRRFIKVRKTLP